MAWQRPVFLFWPFVPLSWSFLTSIAPAVSRTGPAQADNTFLFFLSLVLLKELNILNGNIINTKQKKIRKINERNTSSLKIVNFSNDGFWNPRKPNANHYITGAGLGLSPQHFGFLMRDGHIPTRRPMEVMSPQSSWRPFSQEKRLG